MCNLVASNVVIVRDKVVVAMHSEMSTEAEVLRYLLATHHACVSKAQCSVSNSLLHRVSDTHSIRERSPVHDERNLDLTGLVRSPRVIRSALTSDRMSAVSVLEVRAYR